MQLQSAFFDRTEHFLQTLASSLKLELAQTLLDNRFLPTFVCVRELLLSEPLSK